MKPAHFLLPALALALFTGGCVTTEKKNEPPREKMSSMPHNMPASWEGQAGLPGFASGQY